MDEKPSQAEINRLLEIKGSVNAKLTFDEFYDFMKRVYGDEVPKMEKKTQGHGKTFVQTTTTTTTTTRVKGGTVERARGKRY